MITHCVLRGASYVLRVARCAVRVSDFLILELARPLRLSGLRPACHARHEWAGIADFGLQKGDGPNLGFELGAAVYELRVADRRISGTTLAL